MDRTKLKRYGIGAATFATALTIGFVIQYGDAVASRVGSQDTALEPQAAAETDEQIIMPATASVVAPPVLPTPEVITPSTSTVALTEIPEDINVPTLLLPYDEAAEAESPIAETATEAPEMELAAADVVEDLTISPMTLDAEVVDTVQDVAQSCDLRVLATASDMAMVDLTLDAPCQTEASFAIYHQGMTISAMTDDLGLAQLSIPALNEHALFIVTFEDGASTMAQAFVSDMNDYDRAVLQWQGAHGFELHALRQSAGYGEDGHIWKGVNGSAETGMVASFTNGDYAAEIYTYPAGQSSSTSSIQLNVEAVIQDQNCGKVINAQAIQIGPNRTTGITDLEMTLPDCNAVGEILVLKNIYEDLTFAAR